MRWKKLKCWSANYLITLTVYEQLNILENILTDMAGNIVIVLTNADQLGNTGKKTGWYLPEVAHPYHVFTKAGYKVTFVTPKGGAAPMVSDL